MQLLLIFIHYLVIMFKCNYFKINYMDRRSKLNGRNESDGFFTGKIKFYGID